MLGNNDTTAMTARGGKGRTLVAAVVLLFVAGAAEAQTFLDHLQQAENGSGTITVTQSAELDELVNSTNVSGTTATTTKSTKAENTATKTQEKEATSATTPLDNGNDTEEETVETGKTGQRTHKIKGYRVQLYSGGNTRESKNKAYSIGNSVKRAMPDQSVYVHFNSPRWFCRMGNYRTYEEASAMLREMRSLGYTDACIVSDKISVSY